MIAGIGAIGGKAPDFKSFCDRAKMPPDWQHRIGNDSRRAIHSNRILSRLTIVD